MGRLTPQKACTSAERPPVREVRGVVVMGNPAGWQRAAYVWLRKQAEYLGLVVPRPGRQDIWEAKDCGNLMPEAADVRVVPPSIIQVRARPKARMSFRVYRAVTKEWSASQVVDVVEVQTVSKE